MIANNLYVLRIERIPNSRQWGLYLSLNTDSYKILAESPEKFKTIKAARIYADKDYPELHWANSKKAYLRSL
jgi:hypothetical protein